MPTTLDIEQFCERISQTNKEILASTPTEDFPPILEDFLGLLADYKEQGAKVEVSMAATAIVCLYDELKRRRAGTALAE